jgi:hypothetical protein
MELNPNAFDKTLSAFLSCWTVQRVRIMTVEDYADLSNHDSFCYGLEYGSVALGSIGAIALHKFELWKPKDVKDFKDNRFKTDGKYAWNARKGDTLTHAFEEIRRLIIKIITEAQNQNWEAIDSIEFHAIGKWKIAFIFSNKLLLPIYSKRALLSISKGLGKEFSYSSSVSTLQLYILGFRPKNENIDDFAYRLYAQFAVKKKKRNYYIIGSKYGDENGHDVIPKIGEFLKYNCVAIGFLDWLDFSQYMGADKKTVDEFVQSNWKEKKPAWHKIQRYFYLLSQLREGDIIAVKSHGAYNQLTIIAYAEVVKRNGKIYEHKEDELGHHIYVDFLDANFYKYLGLTYAETIHQLKPNKDGDSFYKVFSWYADDQATDDSVKIIEVEEDEGEDTNENGGEESTYNEKSVSSFERSQSASVKVNLVHNRIQNRFIRYLMDKYPSDINIGEKNRIDAKRETTDEVIIYEIKPFESVYACVRDGIGQLLDYSYQLKTQKAKRLLIVGPNKPEQHDIEFISAIKKTMKLPFGYIAFDEPTLTSHEY